MEYVVLVMVNNIYDCKIVKLLWECNRRWINFNLYNWIYYYKLYFVYVIYGLKVKVVKRRKDLYIWFIIRK